MTQYKPHMVKCIVDIKSAENAETNTDYCICIQDNKSLIIIKYNISVTIYDFKEFLKGNYNKPLNSKDYDTTDEAYKKMIYWMGKMVKKDKRGRYYNNKIDHPYPIVIEKEILDELRNKIKNGDYYV